MYGRHFTFAARTSGQKAKRLEREPTVVNETADRKHHLDLLATQSATFVLQLGRDPFLERCSLQRSQMFCNE